MGTWGPEISSMDVHANAEVVEIHAVGARVVEVVRTSAMDVN